jgi:hypothetical protein
MDDIESKFPAIIIKAFFTFVKFYRTKGIALYDTRTLNKLSIQKEIVDHFADFSSSS